MSEFKQDIADSFKSSFHMIQAYASTYRQDDEDSEESDEELAQQMQTRGRTDDFEEVKQGKRVVHDQNEVQTPQGGQK
jgi:hypothetical protein